MVTRSRCVVEYCLDGHPHPRNKNVPTMAYKTLAAALSFLATAIIFLVTTDVLRAADTVTSATVSSSTVVDKTPPTASSPSIVVNNSDVCQTGVSAAMQTSVFGVSGGTTTRDMNCESIKLARAIYGMGLKIAGISLLCQDARVWNAMWEAGTTCPRDGKIGEAAKQAWLKNPERAPVGAVIRVQKIVEIEIEDSE